MACTDLGGGLGALVCGATPPTVAGWPPAGGTAVLDTNAQTIVVVTIDPNAGTITQTLSYSVVPEPGTLALLGVGLFGICATGRQRVAEARAGGSRDARSAWSVRLPSQRA